MALIHVVIPVYNAEKFLAETVASVLDQPCKDIDIVLVNDGSTDGSDVLCDEIAAKEDRVAVIHQENSGVSKARNAGIEYFLNKNADGYIAFLDSDDLWCPDVFTAELTESILRDRADIVGFSSCGANEEASRFKIISRYEDRTLHFEEGYQTSFLWAQGTFAAHLYHTRLFRKTHILFDPLCKHNEDVIFSAKMFFCSEKIRLMEPVLYIYRTNAVSATHTAKFTQDNARHIPDSWYHAGTYFAGNPDVPGSGKEKWNAFCLDTSAIRCLEMISLLAMNSCTQAQIDSCFRDREYYWHICSLSEDALAPWQREDLKMFQKDRTAFYRYHRKQGFKRKLRRLVFSVGFVIKMLDSWRYTLSIQEINPKK